MPVDNDNATAGGRVTLKKRFAAWWDGREVPASAGGSPLTTETAAAPPQEPPQPAPQSNTAAPPKRTLDRRGRPLWTATRIEVVEKLWGQGFSTPGGADYIPELVKPLGLTPALSVLDLTAGLGGAARTMAATYGSYVTGLEPQPILAELGMQRSVDAGLAKQATIETYDPEETAFERRYDCIFAKEGFFQVVGKDALLDGIATSIKPHGHFLFTDYVLADDADADSLQGWMDNEPVEPRLWRPAQWRKALARRKFDLRIDKDDSDIHQTQVLKAITMLRDFLETRALAQETRLAVASEVELWARRVDALRRGLRVYRFYAMRKSESGVR